MRDSITKVALLAIVLLVAGALFVPAVSAETVYTSEDDLPFEREFSGQSANIFSGDPNLMVFRGSYTSYEILSLVLYNVESYPSIQYFYTDYYRNTIIPEGEYITTYKRPSDNTDQPLHVYVTNKYNKLGGYYRTQILAFPQNWEIGTATGSWKSPITLDGIQYRPGSTAVYKTSSGFTSDFGGILFVSSGYWDAYEAYASHSYSEGTKPNFGVVGSNEVWSKTIVEKTSEGLIKISAFRVKDTKNYYTAYTLYDALQSVVTTDSGNMDKTIGYFSPGEISKILITNPTLSSYNHTILLGSETEEPTTTPTEEPTVLRKGTVTMTDHNGTTITGFEVTAVNAYTDETYTVTTETDVAVMNLPMERTIQIRNPQTGVYEEAAIGYYRFFGQSPGYKMLFEDGIQVAVMPEKYGSYQLCDIGVTSESGYLTGKHQFQIRSRSDNSILQTGTISAKSATTGEWYNTTVSGGLASLILPYDTSNPKSQYAGNYYVYATSPGYEDSDYGTQIVVMPHTVSEIKTVLLTPIGGIPIPGNVTLRIQAISETGPGVVNAEIFIAGVLGAGASVWDTYTASSTGYLTVSVPGNSTYDIVARGAGYYDSARRIEVFTEDPPLIEIKLYLSGAPTLEPTTEPTGWPTGPPPTKPPGGIPDDDDDSDGFLVQAVRGIGLAFGVGFATAKLIFGMLLALAIGFATAKQLRGGAAEFGVGLLGGTLLGVLIGLLPVWIIVVLLLVVGLYIGNRYVGGANNG